jgi:hypothetical protein
MLSHVTVEGIGRNGFSALMFCDMTLAGQSWRAIAALVAGRGRKFGFLGVVLFVFVAAGCVPHTIKLVGRGVWLTC